MNDEVEVLVGARGLDPTRPGVSERLLSGRPGITMLVALIVAIVAGGAGFAVGLASGGTVGGVVTVLAVLVVAAAVLGLRGLTPVVPGQARVVQLFGRYVGTTHTAGLRWFNPLTERPVVSTRVRNHETPTTKVNDADGNPIEIAAVVVWQVDDTARALYQVDDVVRFVGIQAETAVRHIASSYPYDAPDDERLSLRHHAEEINAKLSAEIAERVQPAGVRIIESRLTRLAYAPEIAQAMLRRQQAGAIVAARQRIVEGAVGMVRSALDQLREQDVVDLDDERKAAMVSNLLVVLCGDRDTQPVVNTGSLYQ